MNFILVTVVFIYNIHIYSLIQVSAHAKIDESTHDNSSNNNNNNNSNENMKKAEILFRFCVVRLGNFAAVVRVLLVVFLSHAVAVAVIVEVVD